jgi:hypothetical protein
LSDLDLSQFTTVWAESFDNGTGALSRSWGNVDTSVAGQVTLSSYASDGYTLDSGAMVPPTGATAGNGYGLYSFTLSMDGDAPGPYALLWPATDVWPGPELDIVEVGFDGSAYSTIHFKAADGSNGYTPYTLPGIDPSTPHVYAMDWQADHIAVFVDGQQMYSTTVDVPKDAAHGGENSAPGFGMQTWWSVGAQTGDNHITAYDVSYAVLGGNGNPPPIVEPPVVEPEPPVVVVPPSEDLLHFSSQTPGHSIEGYATGATVSFDGYGANATVTHEIDGAADEYRVAGENGFDTFVVAGVTDLSELHYVFNGQDTPPPIVVEQPPVVVTPPAAEVLHFAAQTADHFIAGYVPGATISFDGYGDGASVSHEIDGAADEYRASGANGFDTFVIPGLTDLSQLHAIFA